MTNEWIAGFFSNGGYFGKQVMGNNLYFHVGIAENNKNLGLINEIMEYLNMGNIRRKGKDACQYRINKKKDVKKFINEICPLLKGHKKRLADNFIKEFIMRYGQE